MGSEVTDGMDPLTLSLGNSPVAQYWRWRTEMCVQVTDLPWLSNQPIEG